MTDEIDISKIPADVLVTAKEWRKKAKFRHGGMNPDHVIALAILTERAACAQHAFAMRWAPPPEMVGTTEAANITTITTSWSHQIGMGILNR